MKKSISILLAFILIVNIWIFADKAYLEKAWGAETNYTYNTASNYLEWSSGSASSGIYNFNTYTFGGYYPNFPIHLDYIPEGVGIKTASLQIYALNSTSGVTLTFSNNYGDSATQYVTGSWKYYSGINITNIMRTQFKQNEKDFVLRIYANQHSKIGANSLNSYKSYSPQIYFTTTSRPNNPIVTQPTVVNKYTTTVPITLTATSPDGLQLKGVVEYKSISSSTWQSATTTSYFNSGQQHTHNWDISALGLEGIYDMRVKVEDANGGFSQWVITQFSVNSRPIVSIISPINGLWSN